MQMLLAVLRRLDAAFLLLLVGVYVLAAVLPAPPAVTTPMPGLRTAQIVLAVLLFVAGLRAGLPHHGGDLVRSAIFIGAGVFGRLLPVVATLACLAAFSAGGAPPLAIDVAVGLAMVAAMPAANTATAWTRRSSGELGVCIGIVVATTLLSPVVIPTTMAFINDSIYRAAQPAFTSHDASLGIVGWVVLPIVAGSVIGRTCGLVAGKTLSPLGSLSTTVALLFLNYVNASQALPSVLDRGGAAALAWAACGAVVLVPLCYAAAAAVSRLSGAPPSPSVALAYAVGMSNTGLASTLATSAFPDRPATLYPIVLCTLLQHIVAAIVHEHGRAATPDVSSSAAGPGRRKKSRAGRPRGLRR